MNKINDDQCRCKHCHFELAPSHHGECPNCGKIGKDYPRSSNAGISLESKCSVERTRISYEEYNKKIKVIVCNILKDILLALIATFIGLLIGGWFGALIGFLFSLIIIIITNVFFRRKDKMKIKETTKFQ